MEGRREEEEESDVMDGAAKALWQVSDKYGLDKRWIFVRFEAGPRQAHEAGLTTDSVSSSRGLFAWSG